MHYFGPWSDADGALKKYLAEKDALHAGRSPRPDAGEFTVKAMVNAFLIQKQALMHAGELSPRTWAEYKGATDLLIAHLGKQRLVSDVGPDDFTKLRAKMADRWGKTRLLNVIQYVRSVFKHAYDSNLIASPVRFGPGFKRPSKKTLRLERAAKGLRMFEAEEIRRMLGAANVHLKAMILLGINCGFGNADCGTLKRSALDLAGGWVNHPRPKTGIERRCPLWPETIEALRESLAKRPTPKDPDDEDLVFITQRGGSWYKEVADSPISKETRKLLDELGINGHRSFYALRHGFETIGGEAKDQVAVNSIMGHVDTTMAGTYRERISDERRRAVTDHVRAWLWPAADATKAAATV
jgi:integrase